MISKFMIESGATADNFEHARRSLYEQGIKSSYDGKRMIFSRTNRNQNTSIYDANGLVLDMNTWKELAVPPSSLSCFINKGNANKGLSEGKYTIYKAQDGTMVTLYYYNNEWVISTSNNFAMNNMKWNGGKTYQQLIEDCLINFKEQNKTVNKDIHNEKKVVDEKQTTDEKKNDEKSNEKNTNNKNDNDEKKDSNEWTNFTNKLNKEHSYTFGFKHPDMHPFFEGKDPIYNIWFIQAIKLEDLTNAALPFDLPTQTKVEGINDIGLLFHYAKYALDKYLEKKEVNYGYILRSSDSKYKSLFVESTLMKTIRKLQYDNPLITTCHENKYDKQHFLALNAYMDQESFSLYRVIFSQYSSIYNTLDKYFNQIADIMAGTKCEIKTLSDIASSLLNKFNRHVKINIMSKTMEQRKGIYRSYITHPDNRMLCEDLLGLMK